ncbi:hypothetical protein V501_10593 [Pseudogymnoascus sp. VKM F-4519 (FW-2642)]|nr:hypothetical protein V501_10593 [Pseudogymnoascus sp. VKM F-4519 (FW-2642)]
MDNARLKAVSWQVTNNVDPSEPYPRYKLIGCDRAFLDWIGTVERHTIGPARLQCDWPDGPSAEEYQKTIDFSDKLAAHNDSQEETCKTRRILLQEWLFATDGPRYAEHDTQNNQLVVKVELS